MGNEFIGRTRTAALRKVRGERGARIRIKAGLQQRTAKQPRAEQGEVARRAEAGFNRRANEMANAKTPEAKAAAHDRAKAALTKYEKATEGAAKSMHEAEARLAKTFPLTPAQIEAAGFAEKGGRLQPVYQTFRNKETGKLYQKQVGFTRVGRDRKALGGGSDLQTYKRLKAEANDAKERHSKMQQKLSQMRQALNPS